MELASDSIWDDEKIRHRIAERVSVYFPDLPGPIDVRISKTTRRAYSQIFEAQISAQNRQTRRIIVKVSASARREYDELQALREIFEIHASCGVATPLDYFSEGPALVMEAVGGSSLQTLFPRWYWGATNLRSAEVACDVAGKWLRVYHAISPTSSGCSIDIEGKLAEFQRTWKDLAAVGFSQRIGAKITCFLESIAEVVAAKSIPAVRVHGDFSIDNIWLDRGRIVVLDISGARRNACELDIAAFMNSLLLMRFGGWISYQTLCSLRRSFLLGYGDDVSVNAARVVFFQATGLVDVLWELWQRRPTLLTRVLSRPVLAGLIKVLDERIS